MKIRKRRLKIYRCDKCGKIPAIQSPPYQRLNEILNGYVCVCDPDDILVWGFLDKYFKDSEHVKKFLRKLPKGHPRRLEGKD